MREVTLTFFLLFQEIGDTSQKHFHIERFGNIGIRSCLIPFSPTLVRTPCRKQDNRYMRSLNVLLDTATQVRAIHPWHHHIAHHEIWIIRLCLQGTFQSILCRQHLIIYIAQFPEKETTEVVIILHHKDSFLYLLRILHPYYSIYRINRSRSLEAIFLRSLLHQGMLQIGRNIHDEARAFALLTFQRNLTMMQFDILIHHVQTYARAYLGRGLRLIGTIETFEHMGLLFLGDATSRIFHHDMSISATIYQAFAQYHLHRTSRLGKLKGIRKKII